MIRTCTIAHPDPLSYVCKAPHTRQDKIGVSAHVDVAFTCTRVSVCVTRRYVSQSLAHSLASLRQGCMRNEASAPFLGPLFIRFPPLFSAVEDDGGDPSYDPYPDPTLPFVDDTDETTKSVSNSPCGSTRRREILV